MNLDDEAVEYIDRYQPDWFCPNCLPTIANAPHTDHINPSLYDGNNMTNYKLKRANFYGHCIKSKGPQKISNANFFLASTVEIDRQTLYSLLF